MIRIVTDSSADITAFEAEQLGITVMPLTITFGDKSYRDGVDISADEFYNLLTSSEVHPTTSQASPQQYEDIFSEARQAGDSVVLLPISQKLSGSHNCAEMVKRQGNYDNVYIVDTLLTVSALRLLVLEAKRLSDTMPVEQLVEHLIELRDRIKITAYVDTLEYLYKGGRVSRAAASVGNLISIKPILEINEGAIVMADKALGTKKALNKVGQKFNSAELDTSYQPCFGYAGSTKRTEELIDVCYGEDCEQASNAKQHMINVSPIVGVHTGPNIALVSYVIK